jgi:O-antigen/teichoic acid export membrane protein
MTALEPEQDILDSRRAGGAIIRGGAIRVGGFLASTLLALLGVALVTRHLGVADFGRFQTVISLITIVGSLTDAGMAALGVREYAQRTQEDRDRLMRTLLGLRIALTLTGAAIAAAIAVAIGYDWDLVLGTALAGLGLALVVVQTTLAIPLMSDLRNVALTLVDLLRQALTVGGYVLLVVLGAGVVAFLGATIPAGIVVVVVAGLLVRGQIPLRPSLEPREWGRLLRAAVAFTLATAVGTIYIYTAQVLTAAVTDAHDTGLFSASFRVYIVLGGVSGLLITVAFPLLSRAARDDHERLAYAIQRLLDTTAILGLGMGLGILVGAPAIIEVMAGSGFAGAVPVLRIQAATLVVTSMLAPIGFALLSLHVHRGILVANLLALLVTLTGVATLAAAFGPEGAALATVMGESTLAVGYYAALHRAAPDLVPGFGPAARGLAAFVPCTAILLVPGLPSWLAATLALVAYAVLLVVVRAVPEELVELLPRRSGRRRRLDGE